MKKAFWNVGVRIQKSAFTLVELIVVIIILAILATIAFAVYEGYTSDARDSKKMEEVSLLHKGLSVAFIKSSKYPEETSMSTIASGSTVLAKQSPVGKTIASFIGVSSDIFSTGSSNSTDYTYTLNSLRSKAQVSVFLEKQKDVTIAVQTGSITKYLFTKGDSIPLLLASDTYEPLGTSGSSTTIDVSSATTPVTAIAGVSST